MYSISSYKQNNSGECLCASVIVVWLIAGCMWLIEFASRVKVRKVRECLRLNAAQVK